MGAFLGGSAFFPSFADALLLLNADALLLLNKEGGGQRDPASASPAFLNSEHHKRNRSEHPHE